MRRVENSDEEGEAERQTKAPKCSCTYILGYEYAWVGSLPLAAAGLEAARFAPIELLASDELVRGFQRTPQLLDLLQHELHAHAVRYRVVLHRLAPPSVNISLFLLHLSFLLSPYEEAILPTLLLFISHLFT